MSRSVVFRCADWRRHFRECGNGFFMKGKISYMPRDSLLLSTSAPGVLHGTLETDTGQRARGRTEHNATLKRPAKTRTLHADMYVGTRDPHQTRGTRKRADGAPAVTSGPSRKRQAARQSPRRIQQELPKGYMRVQIHSARLALRIQFGTRTLDPVRRAVPCLRILQAKSPHSTLRAAKLRTAARCMKWRRAT